MNEEMKDKEIPEKKEAIEAQANEAAPKGDKKAAEGAQPGQPAKGEAPKKEEKKAAEGKPAEKPAEKKAPEGEKKEAAAKPEEPAEKVLPTNCPVCNKVLVHKIWYYRNGQYFCSKRCWKKFINEKKEKDAEKAPAEAKDKGEEKK